MKFLSEIRNVMEYVEGSSFSKFEDVLSCESSEGRSPWIDPEVGEGIEYQTKDREIGQ